MGERFEVVNHLLRAMDRRDPWTAADLVGWLREHYPEYLRSVEPEEMDATSLKLTTDVFQSAIEELRAPVVSMDTLEGNYSFLADCRNDFGGLFPADEIDAAVFALGAVQQIHDDPAFPLIVRNLLDIAAECIEIELRRITAGSKA
jgi:hypothetical protein